MTKYNVCDLKNTLGNFFGAISLSLDYGSPTLGDPKSKPLKLCVSA